jgi:predicted alpha/beta-hydrolase family hydrolase
VIDALLLLSYPLHPPRKPDEKRTKHFPAVRTPSFFVHGTRDPFSSVAEMREAIALIPGPVHLLEWEGAGHDLRTKRRQSVDELASVAARDFLAFAG